MTRNNNAEGVRLYQQGNYLGAVNCFQQALAQQPGSPDCFYNLGATYHQQAKLFARPADMQTAEQYYHLCLARNPNHEACQRGLAVLLVEENRGPEAVAQLQAWSQRQPTNPNPQIELASSWLSVRSANRPATQRRRWRTIPARWRSIRGSPPSPPRWPRSARPRPFRRPTPPAWRRCRNRPSPRLSAILRPLPPRRGMQPVDHVAGGFYSAGWLSGNPAAVGLSGRENGPFFRRLRPRGGWSAPKRSSGGIL
jgi:hypothetical protein